jgi:hypothetical protein
MGLLGGSFGHPGGSVQTISFAEAAGAGGRLSAVGAADIAAVAGLGSEGVVCPLGSSGLREHAETRASARRRIRRGLRMGREGRRMTRLFAFVFRAVGTFASCGIGVFGKEKRLSYGHPSRP